MPGDMKLHFQIALRYIFTLRSFHFITFITIISFVGIVIGVAALICVMSIFNGFGEFTEKQLIGYDPHMRIIPQNGAWLNNYEKILSEVKKNKYVLAASPVAEGRMVGIKADNMKVMELFGYNPNEFSSVSGIDNSIVIGSFKIQPKNDVPRIVLGANLANRLKVMPGDTLSVMSLYTIEASIKSFSRRPGLNFLVTGLFLTNNPEYDDNYAYTSLNTANYLLNAPGNAVSAIDIRLNSIDNVEKVKEELKIKIPGLSIQTWYDLHKELYNILKFERMSVFIILSLIIVIAVFNVLASLSMTVVEKKADIALLKSIGASDKLIKKIFMTLGLLIGSLSTIIGSLLGLGLTLGQIQFGWIKLSGAKFLVTSLPVSIHALDIVLIICVSMMLSFIATIYPARRASSSKIIDTIRSE